MNKAQAFALRFLLLFTLAPLAFAQDEFPTKVTVQNRSGDLPFASTIGGSIDSVDVVSGNLTINVPIVSVPTRGSSFNFGLRYDARFLFLSDRVVSGHIYRSWKVERRAYTVTNGLWETNTPRLTFVESPRSCEQPVGPHGEEFWGDPGTGYGTGSYIYHDASGAKHALRVGTEHVQC